MQETPICDIIHYEDARWRPLIPGDHVLAPLNTSMEQYGPGTILKGAENRERGLGIVFLLNLKSKKSIFTSVFVKSKEGTLKLQNNKML